jgi:hypothetical protein
MKSHLKTSLIPLSSGLDLSADCGKPVRNAQIVHQWDDTKPGPLSEQISAITHCQKCVEKVADTPSGEIEYLYSIAEGDTGKENCEALQPRSTSRVPAP